MYECVNAQLCVYLSVYPSSLRDQLGSNMSGDGQGPHACEGPGQVHLLWAMKPKGIG